jgi:hypothetical protein
MVVRLDWGDQVEARIAAVAEAPATLPELALPALDASTPAALAQMIEDRRSAPAPDADAGPGHALPAKAWREIVQRAATLGVVAELLAEGTEVRLVAHIPSSEVAASATPAPTADEA